MSLKFSRVTLKTNDKTCAFLVGGASERQEDLDPWTAFRDFITDVPKDGSVVAHVETFLYGDEAPFDATPEEVAYMKMRCEMREDFLESRTEKVAEYDLALWVNK